jgi:hypothetical protein
MTVAPSHPPVHSYDPGKNPMELVATPSGPMERWRADALLLSETSAAIQARHDAVTTLDDLEQQKRELAAGQRPSGRSENAVNSSEGLADVSRSGGCQNKVAIEFSTTWDSPSGHGA